MKRHPVGNPRRGKLLYDERVHCSINEVEDIFIPEDKDLVETGVLLIITSLADPVTDRQGAGSMNG